MLNWIDGATVEDAQAVAQSLSPAEASRMLYAWRELWARPEQLMPEGSWRNWLVLAGRGFGKTRVGAEAIRELAKQPGRRFALIGPTAADCRDVMVEGESGLLNVYPPEERPQYWPSRRLIRFPSGSTATTYSAEEPERLRGPQHHYAWSDEIAAYPDPKALWDNLKFGLRLGDDPRVIATTTPKPLRWLKELLQDAGTHVTRGRTVDNRANLPQATLDEFERVYGGTRIGRQELDGELLEEAEGALWRRSQIDALRVRVAPELVRIVIAIDPATTSGATSDDCGIIGCGLGVDGHGYVLEDGSCHLPPDQWATRSVSMFDDLAADRVIAETNNGGDLVEVVIRTVRRQIPYQKVTASRGKVARAEPVAALYEQGRIHHVGAFPALEDEMVNFVPGKLATSPNRADALVWGFSYLMLKPTKEGRALSI